MARKSASASSTSLDPSIAWIAVIIGAVSLFWYFKRKQPPRREQQQVPGAAAIVPVSGKSLKETIADGKNKNWKIAVTWEAVRSLSDEERRLALTRLASSTNLHILAGTADSSSVLAALQGIPSLERHSIMFCSTEKGYEAFCRQLTPTVLVSGKTELCNLLLRFVPWVVHVGAPTGIGRNLLDIGSFGEFPLLS
ncbi:GPI-anchored surface protein, putative [Bodo saltans]|uniref:GPI-anchored surface protein, putative n=1 Tax=Bodo saltans TaxID=75058 RepID=A0A0S4JN26_BODSA|nr:GPI-anchored surface protein, putative [Bodo saltans]|eukprot:CUG91649.1 GPI-anchored surface protein, putative [Bodo saltans]